MKLNRALTAIVAISVTAAAQQSTSIDGAPVLGYIFDRSVQALRPIVGMPRAALIGAPVESGFSMQNAIVLGETSYALALSASGSAGLIDLTARHSVTELPLAGRARALYSSPRGTAAAVLTDNWVGFITGVSTGNPQVAGMAMDAQPASASVSDDGMYLLAALPDASLLMLGRDGARASIAIPGPASRVVFRPGSRDALAVSTDNRAWLIQSAAVTQIAGPEDGLAQPVGLGFLPDGSHAVIANSSGAILTIDVRSGSKSSAVCACTPTRLEPLATPGVFRLTEALAEPQYMFDGSSMQTFFVPAAPLKKIREKNSSDRRPQN